MQGQGRAILAIGVVASLALFFASGKAVADPSYFTARCALCHADDTPTCDGCHGHVVGGLKAVTDKQQY